MIPAGWKLVPIEPTDDMVFEIYSTSEDLNQGEIREIYTDMLKRAPEPPLSQRETELAAAKEEPGAAGAMCRLLARCDFDEIKGWVAGEALRNTSPDDTIDVVAWACTKMILETVQPLRAGDRVEAGKDIIGRVIARVKGNLEKPAPKQLRIITEGRDHG